METNSPNGGQQSETTQGQAPQTQYQNDDTQPRQAASGDRQKPARTGSRTSGQDRTRAMSTQRGGNLSRSSGASSPFTTMARLSREMDQLFDSFFGNRFGFPRLARNWP